MKKILPALFLLLVFPAFAQNNTDSKPPEVFAPPADAKNNTEPKGKHFQIVSVTKASRVKDIGTSPHVSFELKKADSAGYKCISYQVDGFVDSLSDDEIFIRPTSISIEWESASRRIVVDDEYDYENQRPLLSFPRKDVVLMTIDRRIGNVFGVPGGTLVTVGIVGGLFAAPLIGYNWGDNSFSGERYLRTIKYCLISIGAGFALAIPGALLSERSIRCNSADNSANWDLQMVK